MKVVLCSTNDFIRERWKSILQGHQLSIYQASSGKILQSLVHKNEKYLLLIHQPFLDLQAIASLCRMQEAYKVFVLSDTPCKKDGIVLLQMGVVGYANTYLSEGRFLAAVKAIQSGRVWFSQAVLAQFIQAINANKKAGFGPDSEEFMKDLTGREREIAILVSQGLSNKAIGDQLYVSERTVKSHLSSIFSKTGVQSRLKLALLING